MLHKVTIGYFRLYEDGRKRPDFHTVFVEAETGDEAADAAQVAWNGKLPDQAPDTRIGVHGIDVPTAEEVAAYNAPAEVAEVEAEPDKPKRGRKKAD